MPALSARKIGVYATGSPEWHAARDGKMSGSRIAAAAGLSPWTSVYTLHAQMAGDIGDEEQSEEMQWGTRNEPAIIDKCAELHPDIKVIRKHGTWGNKARPWQLANPDALLRLPSPKGKPEYAVFEAKTATYPTGWGEPGTDEIPLHYLCQVYWYLATLGLRLAIVGVLFGGNKYREYAVELDDGAAAELQEIGRAFLDRLEAGIYPDLDGSSSTLQTLKELHPDIDGTSIDVPDEIVLPVIRAKSRLVVPTAEFGEAKANFVDFMGTAKVAFWHGLKVADRRSKNGGTPYVQFASNLPAPGVVPTAPVERETA